MYLDDDEKTSKTTDTGEFIPSYFTWETLKNQKKRANELNNMTKDEN